MPILKSTGLLQIPGLLGGRVTTVVFDQGYSVWTCPAGVTNLLSVYGIGGEGLGDYWHENVFTNNHPYNICTSAVVKGATESTTGEVWQTIIDEVTPFVDAVNAGAYPGYEERDWTGGGERYERHIDQDNHVDISPTSPADAVPTKNPLRIRGRAEYSIDTLGPIQSTEQILNDHILGIDAGVFVKIECVIDGRAGQPTTCFGFTFPGGQLSGSYPNTIALDPVPASHANVAVTPGQDYYIGNAGTLIISYITP